MKKNIIDYLEKEMSLNEKALTAYDSQAMTEQDPEVIGPRLSQSIKLNDRVVELKRHIQEIGALYDQASGENKFCRIRTGTISDR